MERELRVASLSLVMCQESRLMDGTSLVTATSGPQLTAEQLRVLVVFDFDGCTLESIQVLESSEV